MPLIRQLKAALRDHLPEPLVERLRQLGISSHWLADMYRFNLAQAGNGTLSTSVRNALHITGSVLDPKWVLFRPEVPAYGHAIYKICLHLGYRITGDRTRPFEIAINWEDTAFGARDQVLSRLAATTRVVNLQCQDTSKTRVADVFAQAFGYPLAVDPRTHRGTCVRKSEANAQHDGAIVACPSEREAGFAYQRLLDNEVPGGLVRDMRVPVIGTELPFGYIKYRPVAARFRNLNTKVELASVADLFSREEVDGIVRFCGVMGLDYGEIDVLRNREDERIYIVDVNATPSGPPNHLSPDGARTAVAAMAKSFQGLLSRFATGPSRTGSVRSV